ncbi:PTS lactose/cellobiose transporter subunit IIA [Halobacillus shinanisalinarum]
MNTEEIIFQLISHGGNARSSAMEAIHSARETHFRSAEESIGEARKELREAHRVQTEVIQAEARGEKKDISLLFIHAQDHLMNAMTITDLAEEIIKIHRKLF